MTSQGDLHNFWTNQRPLFVLPYPLLLLTGLPGRVVNANVDVFRMRALSFQ